MFFSFFEGPFPQLHSKYAQVNKTLMLTFFYAPLLPIGIPIAIGSISIMYWIEKVIIYLNCLKKKKKTLLIRRDARPPPIGKELAEEMIDFYVELIIILFAV